MRTSASFLAAIVAILCVWQGNAPAISEGGAIFLLIRPGARACGMGSAFAAVADDASATYFNPAGLAFLKTGTPTLSASDVRDWPRLLDSFRESDSTYMLADGDIADPGRLLVVLTSSPLVARSDVVDWPRTARILGDTARQEVRALRAALAPEQTALIDAWSDDGTADEVRETALVAALNILINRAGLYRRSTFPGVALAPPAVEALVPAIPDTLTADNIPDPAALIKRLRTGDNAVARRLSQRIPAALGNQPADAQPGTGAATRLQEKLAGIINREISRGRAIADQQELAALKVSSATIALSERRLTGQELVRFNRIVLLELFAPELALAHDSGRLPAAETRIVNRSLLESLLDGALAGYRSRPAAETMAGFLRIKLADDLEQIARSYDGSAPMPDADARQLADGINRLLLSPDFYQDERFTAVRLSEPTRELIAERLMPGPAARLNRALLEDAFPGVFRRAGDNPTPVQHLRSRLSPVSRDILAQYSQGRTLTAAVRKRLVEDLNAVLSRRDFYSAAVFAGYALPDDGQELVNAGIDNLSKDQVQKLNRRLLEAVYPAELAKMKGDVRYATLMHSPWLSEIWGDVGDMYYEFMAYAQPVKDWGVFGGSIIFLSEGQNYRTGSQGEDLGVFSSFEFSPVLSYGNRIYENLAGGINLKLIHSHLAPFAPEGTSGKGVATTWAIDLGALYRGPIKGMSVGLNVQNLGPNLVYVSAEQADPLSRNIRGGIAYRVLDGKYTRLTAAFDLTKTVVYLNRPWRTELEEAVQHWGVEYWYLGPANLAVRSGYVYDFVGKIIGPTFGFGVGYKFIEFDFSMEPGGELQKYNRKFSLSAKF